MVTKIKQSKAKAKRRYCIFGSYKSRADALNAAKVLRKAGHSTRTRKNAYTGKWNVGVQVRSQTYR